MTNQPTNRSSVLLLCLHPSCGVFRFPDAQDHITLEDYEIHDGMGLEMYYN